MVAERGELVITPISPTSELGPSTATLMGPAGVSIITWAWPSRITKAASLSSPWRKSTEPGS